MTTMLVESIPLREGARMDVWHEGEVLHPKVKNPWKVIRHYFYSEAGP